jgi:NMD protein affecting ribosome stability and mRNA decay
MFAIYALCITSGLYVQYKTNPSNRFIVQTSVSSNAHLNTMFEDTSEMNLEVNNNADHSQDAQTCICASCGKKINKGDRFCMECGARQNTYRIY